MGTLRISIAMKWSTQVEWAVVLLCLIFLFVRLDDWGVLESSEARYALIAQEMLWRGDFIHPYFLYIPHYGKPPLTYQITSLGIKIFGANGYGFRFFLQLSLLLQVWFTYLIGKRLFTKRIGIYAAIALASFPLVIAASRNLTTDSFLLTAALISTYFVLRYFDSNRKKTNLYLFTLFLGVGFLIKGFTVFILPGALWIYLCFERKQRIKFGLHTLWAFLLFALVGLSWYAIIGFQNPAILDHLIQRETIDRIAHAAVFHRNEPFYYFLIFTPAFVLPWWCYLINAYRKKGRSETRQVRYLLYIAFLLPLLIFSLSSSKRIFYILSLLPPLAWIIGFSVDRAFEGGKRASWIYLNSFFLLVALGISLLGLTRLHTTLLISISGVGFVLFFALLFISKTACSQRFTLSSLLFLLLLLWVQPLVFRQNEESFNGLRPIAMAIQKDFPDKNIWVFDRLIPSLRLYTAKDLDIIVDQNSDVHREARFLKGKPGEARYHDPKNRQVLENLESNPLDKAILVVYKRDMRNKYCQMLTSKFAHRRRFDKCFILY